MRSGPPSERNSRQASDRYRAKFNMATKAGIAASIEAVTRLIDREVWVVTAANGPRRGGLTATWISLASIDPERPILLAGIAPNHATAELIDASRHFAAHLLRPDQAELAWNFARGSSRDRDKLAGLATREGPGGAPILVDSLAWLACRVIHRYDAGDRLFYWAEVVAGERVAAAAPLREQAFVQSLTDGQRQELAASRDADIAVQRPLGEEWRQTVANLWPGESSH
jgi:flavin reductase (DIM6/NTAB) family NADH-FMN oxidoreductase RutF